MTHPRFRGRQTGLPTRSFGLGIALALALVAAAPAAAAQAGGTADGADSGDIFPFEVHETTLDNGLKVVAIPYDSPGIIAYYSVVRTGSRDEVEEGHSGFAHFFEHMMFRGTERFSQTEFNDVLKGMGADSNAFTTDDYTAYHAVGPASALETLMDIESDRFRNLEYEEAAFRTEALAVLGEYNKNASNPFSALFETLQELAFDEHTYEHTTMGFLEDIKAMPGYYDYSLSFFDRFYRPENVIVLVVGDVDPERAFAMAKKYYGPWEAGYQAPDIPVEPPQTEERRGSIDWPNPIRPHLVMGWKTPAFSTESVDTAALDLITQLLFSETGPVYQKLVVEDQTVDFVGASSGFNRDPYLFLVYTRARSEELLPKAEAEILAAFERLKEEPVTAERLERIKSHLRYQLALGLDSPGAVASVVADFLNLTGDVDSINQLYAQYQKVTPQDIQRVAREIFQQNRRTTVSLTHAAPEATGDDTNSADTAAGER